MSFPSLTEEDLARLRSNPRLLFRECIARNISVLLVDWENDVFMATFGKHCELLQDIDGSIMPYAASVVAGSKYLTKVLLRNGGINCPAGIRGLPREESDILSRVKSVSPPWVVKPSNGTGGHFVFTGIESEAGLVQALRKIAAALNNIEVLIEEQQSGQDLRIFITSEGCFAAIYREPAHVIGDGMTPIKILAVNESMRRMNPRVNCLCEILLDADAVSFLEKHGRTLHTVPADQEKVYVRAASNVSLGGVAHDVTETVHPSYVHIAMNVLRAIPGLPYAGVDFIVNRLDEPASANNHTVVEVNSLPGLGIHMAPATGKSRNVAGMVVDMLFPETKG